MRLVRVVPPHFVAGFENDGVARACMCRPQGLARRVGRLMREALRRARDVSKVLWEAGAAWDRGTARL
jgi:hypothetical protein